MWPSVGSLEEVPSGYTPLQVIDLNSEFDVIDFHILLALTKFLF